MAEQTDLALRELQRTVTHAQELLGQVSRRTQVLLEARAQGRDYADIVPTEERPLVVELLSDVLEELSAAGARFRRSEARVLHEGGMSQETIAQLFGVTRQRVGALLSSPR